MTSLRYWLGVVLFGLLVTELVAVLAYFLVGLHALVLLFVSALITGVVFEAVTDRWHLGDARHWVRYVGIAVVMVVVQFALSALNVNLVPWAQLTLVAIITYLVWDGFLGHLLGAGQAELMPAHG